MGETGVSRAQPTVLEVLLDSQVIELPLCVTY